MTKPQKVLFVSGEVWPFIKTGGLGDVAYALPKTLVKEGVDVRVILPKYVQIPEKYKKDMVHLGHKHIYLSWRKCYLGIESLQLDGITYYFVDCEFYFNRLNVYGEGDDCERFAFFSKAVIESMDITGFTPDLIHCNDWHTGPVALFLNEKNREGLMNDIKTIFTIHNLRFQGVFPYEKIEAVLGVDPVHYFYEEGIKFHHGISFMKAGVNYSDYVTTVSETYAEEIKTPFFGEDLEGLFQYNSNRLFGITNGIDYEIFNPEKDSDIPANFSVNSLEGKIQNKLALQKKFNLTEDKNIPVIAIITRLDRQKGLDLIMGVFKEILSTGAQFVLLGNGDHGYENFFSQMCARYPGSVGTFIGFDNSLAKLIYAGADMFLMPSQFEPCGLSQLISMRYGTIPIVRETGGLKDTVIPFNEFTLEGNGFSFTNYNAHEMLFATEYAIKNYHGPNWNKIVKNAMDSNNSWEISGKKYLELYRKLF